MLSPSDFTHKHMPPWESAEEAALIAASEMGVTKVKVIGLGGGGSNAVNRMIELGLIGADFIAANTDKQALSSSLAPQRLQLGPRVTRGLGAGGDPKIGAAAAMESSREIAAALQGADMVFLTAGMGGGTGTGAAPIAAEIARELGAVVISIVTLPFTFEMTQRARNALKGVRLLQPHSHTLITVPNDRLLAAIPKTVSLEVAFRFADDVLRQGIQGIVELVTRPGLINVDFAHVRSLMQKGGGALMAIGLGEGPEKARAAVQQALHHPLLEIDSLAGASGALVHFTGGNRLSLVEVGHAVQDIRETLPPEAELILGATTEPAMEGRAQVILIITGLGGRPVRTHSQTGPRIQAMASPRRDDDENLDLPAFLRRRPARGLVPNHQASEAGLARGEQAL